MKHAKISFTLLAASLLGLSSITLQATMIAQDEFLIGAGAYTGDSNPSISSPVASRLINQNPSTLGFSGAWGGNSGNQVIVDSDTTLSITGRTSEGGLAAGVHPAATTSDRPFSPAAQATLAAANTIWFSALMQTGHQAGTDVFRLTGSGGSGAAIGQRLNGVQVKLTDSAGATGGAILLNGGGTATVGEAFTQNDTGTGLWSINTAYLLVGRLTLDRTASGLETLAFWKLTDAGAFSEGSPFITTQRDIFDSVNTVPTGVQLQKNQAPTLWDSFRIGTSSLDVVSDFIAVPEPATALMFLVGGLTVYLRRRRG